MNPVERHLRSRVEAAARALAPATAAISRDLHRHPELSEEEGRSAARITRFLQKEGFRVRRGVAGLRTAFVARRGRRRGGACVAFLAEDDALPGIGHACGHNLIGAAAAGAGAALGRVIDELHGEVVVIGTPAEETIGGKVRMAERGAFRGVDAALMIHPSVENRVYTTSLACHSLEVTYLGRAAHAVAAPEQGINALDALIRLFLAVQRLKHRLPPEVRMPGVILEGGRRANIVPDRAVGRFTLRARDLKTLARVESKFRAAARSAAVATGARVLIRSIDHPYAQMVTNRVLADRFRMELRRLGRRTIDSPRRRMGSLDMGNVSQKVPAIHPYIAVAPAAAPLHSRAFARYAGGPRGRRGLEVAVRALALTGLAVIADRSILHAARAEFVRFRRSKTRRGR